MSAMTNLFAGVPVSDLDAGIDWYMRFFASDQRIKSAAVSTEFPEPGLCVRRLMR